MNRRGFFTGLVSALAAPAIIRTPGLLMAISSPPLRHPELRYMGLAQLKVEGMVTYFDNTDFYWMGSNGFYRLPATINP